MTTMMMMNMMAMMMITMITARAYECRVHVDDDDGNNHIWFLIVTYNRRDSYSSMVDTLNLQYNTIQYFKYNIQDWYCVKKEQRRQPQAEYSIAERSGGIKRVGSSTILYSSTVPYRTV